MLWKTIYFDRAVGRKRNPQFVFRQKRRSKQYIVPDAIDAHKAIKAVPFNDRFVDCQRPLVPIPRKYSNHTDIRQPKIED